MLNWRYTGLDEVTDFLNRRVIDIIITCVGVASLFVEGKWKNRKEKSETRSVQCYNINLEFAKIYNFDSYQMMILAFQGAVVIYICISCLYHRLWLLNLCVSQSFLLSLT